MGGKGSGRPTVDVDLDVLEDLANKGISLKDSADELGVSVPTLTKRIASLEQEQGVLLHYRKVQSLQLTQLQAKILDNVSDEKIADASLKDLMFAFKILKEYEIVIEEKTGAGKVRGLLAALIEMEQEKANGQEAKGTNTVKDEEGGASLESELDELNFLPPYEGNIH